MVYHGRISSAKDKVGKLARQLQSKYPDATLHFVYEAGPCGYWICRYLARLGHGCYVVAPSFIAKKPGDKVKTDKRDAMKPVVAIGLFCQSFCASLTRRRVGWLWARSSVSISN